VGASVVSLQEDCGLKKEEEKKWKCEKVTEWKGGFTTEDAESERSKRKQALRFVLDDNVLGVVLVARFLVLGE
jgi:hypothetical protein